MDRYKIKWTRLQEEIFRFLCIKAGQVFNLRGMATKLGVSPTAVSNALVQLEKERFIKVIKSKTMNLMSIELNRDNRKAIEIKRTENLRLIYESGLPDFLFNKFPGCAVFLFGSYSRGEDVWYGEDDERSSDVDIAVIGTKGKEAGLADFENALERKIIINFYESWSKIHKHLKNNILNGITLAGGVEL
jgi:predicted nucleotidyltransferase